jgi:hypothetical protein
MASYNNCLSVAALIQLQGRKFYCNKSKQMFTDIAVKVVVEQSNDAYISIGATDENGMQHTFRLDVEVKNGSEHRFYSTAHKYLCCKIKLDSPKTPSFLKGLGVMDTWLKSEKFHTAFLAIDVRQFESLENWQLWLLAPNEVRRYSGKVQETRLKHFKEKLNAFAENETDGFAKAAMMFALSKWNDFELWCNYTNATLGEFYLAEWATHVERICVQRENRTFYEEVYFFESL